jgi:hypothetical protein
MSVLETDEIQSVASCLKYNARISQQEREKFCDQTIFSMLSFPVEYINLHLESECLFCLKQNKEIGTVLIIEIVMLFFKSVRLLVICAFEK